MARRKELSKEERVSNEMKRLLEIFSDLDGVSLASIDGLLRRAAYMRVTLEDYEKDLDKGGYVEMFTQSTNTPPYERERPVARLYNSMNRNYQLIMKQLVESLPKEAACEASEILSFIGGSK